MVWKCVSPGLSGSISSLSTHLTPLEAQCSLISRCASGPARLRMVERPTMITSFFGNASMISPQSSLPTTPAPMMRTRFDSTILRRSASYWAMR